MKRSLIFFVTGTVAITLYLGNTTPVETALTIGASVSGFVTIVVPVVLTLAGWMFRTEKRCPYDKQDETARGFTGAQWTAYQARAVEIAPAKQVARHDEGTVRQGSVSERERANWTWANRGKHGGDGPSRQNAAWAQEEADRRDAARAARANHAPPETSRQTQATPLIQVEHKGNWLQEVFDKSNREKGE